MTSRDWKLRRREAEVEALRRYADKLADERDRAEKRAATWRARCTELLAQLDQANRYPWASPEVSDDDIVRGYIFEST